MSITRRDLIRTTTALAAGAAGARLIGAGPARAAEEMKITPEEGASLRVTRWAPFVDGDEKQWLANTQQFTKDTGIDVRIDKESWEDIRPKAAVAASVGSGPDIMWVWFDDPQQYPDKLLDLTDLADYLGNKYGGWYDGPKAYATHDGKFVGLPIATIGNAIVYRKSWVKEAGFDEFPKDTDGFLKLCQALHKIDHPAGFTHGHGVGDGNNYAHWLLWSHGGKMVDENSNVAIDSPETIDAIKYAMALYKTFIPGTESWLDVNNNRAFLAGQV
ncbi:MAG TPA: extracellular solute-binding protein, partial [Pararhizobium sp.]|nr:extracellular solute-binding protein [Pararhizobium sp.]